MTTREVAEAFTALLKEDRLDEVMARFWADDIVSREAMEGPMAVLQGREAVKGKSDWWMSAHEIHAFGTEGPFVHGDQFSLIFDVDVTEKATGKRVKMREIGLYTVKGGKVAEERFFY